MIRRLGGLNPNNCLSMNRRELLRVSALTAGLTVVPFFAGLCAERYMVQVNRYRIPVPNLPPQFNGFTIVHLTDLHYGLVSQSFVRNVVNQANSLKRDVIVCTGDFVHHRNSDPEITEDKRSLACLVKVAGAFRSLLRPWQP
jgi:predicted MPP superfamily phosphohydrolase